MNKECFYITKVYVYMTLQLTSLNTGDMRYSNVIAG